MKTKTILPIALLVGLTTGLAAQDTTAAAAAAPAAQSSVTVEGVLARNVVDRAPQDTGVAFPPDVAALALWMRVTGGAGQTLNHVWYHGDTEVGNAPVASAGIVFRLQVRHGDPPIDRGTFPTSVSPWNHTWLSV